MHLNARQCKPMWCIKCGVNAVGWWIGILSHVGLKDVAGCDRMWCDAKCECRTMQINIVRCNKMQQNADLVTNDCIPVTNDCKVIPWWIIGAKCWTLARTVRLFYRYFCGNYHIFDSFGKWYGKKKSGMVKFFWLFWLFWERLGSPIGGDRRSNPMGNCPRNSQKYYFRAVNLISKLKMFLMSRLWAILDVKANL